MDRYSGVPALGAAGFGFSNGKGVKGRRGGWSGPQPKARTRATPEGEANPDAPWNVPTLPRQGQEKQAKRRAASDA
jgi:hypothetical protein